MSKKPITWLEIIKQNLSEEKSKGNSPSINDIMPAAKKEWAQVKAGTHPKYIQGKAKTYARKKNGNKKSRKADKSSSMADDESPSKSSSKKSKSSSMSMSKSSSEDIQKILAEIKMCAKCKKKVEKIMKKKEMQGGNAGCSSCGGTAFNQQGGCLGCVN
jgi:hypothetical protein